MAQWGRTFLEAADMTGKSLRSYTFMKELMSTAGFVDIEEKNFKIPVGTWPSDPKMKELGRWGCLFCLEGLESWALYLLSQILKVGNYSLNAAKRDEYYCINEIGIVGIYRNSGIHSADEKGAPIT
jgi:hypothetical protein